MSDIVRDALFNSCKYFRVEEYKNKDSLCQVKITRREFYKKRAEECNKALTEYDKSRTFLDKLIGERK